MAAVFCSEPRLGEEPAGIVQQGDLIGGQTLHAMRHQRDDAVGHGVAQGGSGLQPEHDTGRGRFLVAQEGSRLGLHDMNAGLRNRIETHDRFGQFGLQGPAVIDMLQEGGHAQGSIVEQLKAFAAFAGQAVNGQIEPKLLDLVGGYQDGGAARGQAEGDVLGLELAGDGAGVLRHRLA